MNERHRCLSIAGYSVLAFLGTPNAGAHVSVASGPAHANTSQEVAFGVGHGCEGMDTFRVEVEIPTGVTSVRPETSDFGQTDVMTDEAGSVVMVSWQKSEQALLGTDSQYYKLLVRLKTPDAPFTTLFFPAHQTCRSADGTLKVVDWVGLDDSNPDVEPAPALAVIPARFRGWNQVTVPTALENLGAFFPDAEIVWRGNSAFSVNPTTVELIDATEGVRLLEALAPGDRIWIKY